ncbi:MAG: hypothetical protein SPJ93_15680 [Treponema sp.]|nr:hypothetical protein [Treponema sp.]
MNVDLVFAIFAGILLVVGFIGTFVPVLPGAPLAWLGLLLAFFFRLLRNFNFWFDNCRNNCSFSFSFR